MSTYDRFCDRRVIELDLALAFTDLTCDVLSCAAVSTDGGDDGHSLCPERLENVPAPHAAGFDRVADTKRRQ